MMPPPAQIALLASMHIGCSPKLSVPRALRNIIEHVWLLHCPGVAALIALISSQLDANLTVYIHQLVNGS
eukprot:5192411-Pleurochrysis_carterae.AAC.6